MNDSLPLPGHGAKQRPDHLKTKDRVAGAIIPFDWSKSLEDVVGVIANLFGITDKDQGGSLSCTVQTTAYGFVYCTGKEISVEDIYSHVRLPSGGAYLNAPLDYIQPKRAGVVPLSKYPDPHPETEDNMKATLTVVDGDRIRTFELTYTFYPTNIDGAARAISEHCYIHLGIKGSWISGWDKSWIDPSYQGKEDWDHALFAGKESIVLRHGVPAIKAKSSWCEHKDQSGQQVYCHYLNKPYFDAGGVFEIIGVDIRETTKMLTVKDVQQLQALEGYSDPAGAAYWGDGTKTLEQYLAARLADKVKTIQASQ